MASGFDHLLSEGVISEILARLQQGKEAEVYVVRFGGKVVAAKVYKDRATRSFKNNSSYKEGRSVRNTRSQRAMDRGSKFGKAAAEDAWKSAEADALYKLHAEGVRVPTPVLFLDGVLLMELVLDAEGNAAPRLIDADLTPAQANAGYHDMLGQLVRILSCDMIHGDLSPYNVLWGVDGPVVIDFPQIVSASHNSSSERFFLRDAENILGHFAKIDPSLMARRSDPSEIWRAYLRRELTPEFRPTGRAQHQRPAYTPRPAFVPRPAPAQQGGAPARAHQGPPPRQHEGPPPSRQHQGPPPSRQHQGPPPPRQHQGPPPSRQHQGPPPPQHQASPEPRPHQGPPPRHQASPEPRPHQGPPPRRHEGPPPPRRHEGPPPPRQHQGPPPRRHQGPPPPRPAGNPAPRQHESPLPRPHEGPPPRRHEGPPPPRQQAAPPQPRRHESPLPSRQHGGQSAPQQGGPPRSPPSGRRPVNVPEVMVRRPVAAAHAPPPMASPPPAQSARAGGGGEHANGSSENTEHPSHRRRKRHW